MKRLALFLLSALLAQGATANIKSPPSVTGGGGGGGTVTSTSVVTANGLAGTVANPTTTPAITLSTSVTGVLQGDGTTISAATTTGTGSVVEATSPTLVTPALGTPSALVLTNATGLPTSALTGTLAAGQFPALTGDCTTTAGALAVTCVQAQSLTGNLGSAAATGVTAAGRALTVSAGPGGSTSGNAGILTIQGGSTTDGNGGRVNITGTNAAGTATNRNGGPVFITAGNGFLGGAGAQINVTAGTGGATGVGGAFSFTAGSGGATSGNGGGMQIHGGAAVSGTGGNAVLNGGDTSSGTGGSVQIYAGSGTTNGTVQLLAPDAGAVNAQTDVNGNWKTNHALLNCGYRVDTPTTGGSVTISDSLPTEILNPAGTLATLTVTMSAAPVDGQIERILTTQTVTTLTVSPNSGQTVLGAPTTTTVSNGYAWQWVASLSTWVRLY